MFRRSLAIVALIGVLAGIALAQEKANGDKPDETNEAQTKASSLDELRMIIQPMLEPLDLSAEQKRKADGAMADGAWKATLKAFDKKRGGEIRRSTHKTVPEAMPTIMMPRMMAYNMQKTMKERMAKKAGPPTPEQIAAIRAATQKRMRAKFAPSIMGNVEELTAKRVEELLLDKKVLLRVLAEEVSEAALTEEQTERFDKTLTDAGYPAALIHGPDPILKKRVRKMLEKLADDAIAELKKADSAAEKGKKSRTSSGHAPTRINNFCGGPFHDTFRYLSRVG